MTSCGNEDPLDNDQSLDKKENDDMKPLISSATLEDRMRKPANFLRTRSRSTNSNDSGLNSAPSKTSNGMHQVIDSSSRQFYDKLIRCTDKRQILRSTLLFMNFLARILLWSSLVVLAAAVVWYSLELKNNGTDTHLIAWFSAGAFVIMGFPISIYGIFMHLTHYYQPEVQCYIVRILWMVPIYSIESWLCLRFNQFIIYIETLRDCYEAYVLYSFLQFLINVLGGEMELILSLKDKSPTRGVHMKPLHCCIKPWLMGQPVMRKGGRVQWTSPFFVNCKFGVLQYVLLRFFTAIITMILELNGMYKEGDFSPNGGYLYICIITNTSQCWALYCLAFFYYATKNELAPISPVGKFLSVKALVFFTWWQSLAISILVQMKMIPTYSKGVFEWSEEDVAKVIQDYLICIEMFICAIVHVFVFPHTEYSDNKDAALSSRPSRFTKHPRLGRVQHVRQRHMDREREKKASSKHSDDTSHALDLENNDASMVESLVSPAEFSSGGRFSRPNSSSHTVIQKCEGNNADLVEDDASTEISTISTNTESSDKRTGFVKAFLDSTVPRDLVDHSVGIVKGDYTVQKKTLLHHATTSDDYDLFVSSDKGFVPKSRAGLQSASSAAGASQQRQQQRRKKLQNKPPGQMNLEMKSILSSPQPLDHSRNTRKKATRERNALLNSSANAVSFSKDAHSSRRPSK